ncbi:MAG TPA: AarF/UbiB family protein [Acidimicrobiales bacterium]|nr:AarF/UbiB family protein [Acidimicrobiales bacterium]
MPLAPASAPLIAASLTEVALRVATAGAIAVVTTALSMRLLGARRGWPTSLFAGFLGWGVAGVLALALAGWDWGADGLVLQTLAIGVPATMAVAVSLDLLARPGTLARGELAGLVVAPRPLRALRTRIAVLRRYRQLLGLARKEGFGPLLSAGGRLERSAKSTGVRIRRLLEEAGGVYVKLGQIAATRLDLLPPEICAELARLQNRVPPEPVERIRPALEAELGAQVAEVFADFDWEPLASASIGQTYRATLHSGEAVVVKIQRPGIHEVIERDLAALALLADLAQRRTEVGQGLRSAEMLDHFAHSLRAELDFRREADAMAEMDLLLDGTGGLRIPKVYDDFCTPRLLVQERFEGCTLSDRHKLDALGVDRHALAQQLLRATLDQVLRIGFFHADPHPGNVFVFADGTLGLIDFGAVGRLDSIQQGAVIEIMAAFVRRDANLLRNGVERVADVAGAAPPERIERALARLMADNIRATGTIEPTVLQDLVSTLAEFGVRLPADLVVLSRALITLDGTLRVLSPGISLVPAVTELMTSPTSPPILDREALIRDEILSALPRLRRLPDHVDRILTLTGRGDLRVRSIVDEDRQRILRTLVNRALLTVIGLAFLLLSGVLLVAADNGPTVASGTGLFEILGYGALLSGTVLVLRVVTAVARDGTT